MAPKKWVKLWVSEGLRGTIRFDFTPEERGIWYDLLMMAGDSRHDGFIAPNDRQPYPDEWIAATLNVPLKLFKRVITKCIETERIEMTAVGYRVSNWSKYQSEYDRQKKYREEKKQTEGDNSNEPSFESPFQK